MNMSTHTLRPGRVRCLLAALGATLLALTVAPVSVHAQGVLSRFAGSVEKGVYETDYDAFLYAATVGRDAEPERVEGSLVSRVYVKPQNKSNLEVFRSYERELEAGGFTIQVAETPSRDLQQFIWKIYRTPYTDLVRRPYRNTEDRVLQGDLARVATFADYYLVARRTVGDETLHVGIILSNEQHLYMIDELTTAAMETGTVSIDIDQMRTEIERSGKIAVYDIHFATGSAVIEPESADALAVIAQYLGETTGGFYIVGHTDDTGTLESNLTLSEQRAAAVKQALVTDHGIVPTRLETRGVGPLVPVSTNTDDAGRAVNRRVEIVQRLR